MKLSLLGYYMLADLAHSAVVGYRHGQAVRAAREAYHEYMDFPERVQSILFEATAYGNVPVFFSVYRSQRPDASIEEMYGAINRIKQFLEAAR